MAVDTDFGFLVQPLRHSDGLAGWWPGRCQIHQRQVDREVIGCI